MRPLRVFLCHSSADKPAVRELYEQLTARGIDAWLDEKKLLPGQQWKIEIPKAVREADAVIICLSKSSITKEGYVQKEIKFALDVALEKPEGTIYLIPARLEECEVPYSLSEWHWVNLFDTNGLDLIFKSLASRSESLEPTIQPARIQEKKSTTRKPKKAFIEEVDSLFDDAIEIARKRGEVSAAILKSKLRIGYPRAAQILLMMERKEIIGIPEGELQIHKVLDFGNTPAQLTEPILTVTSKSPNENKIALSNGMEFMCVPAGKFIMGSEKYDDEKPQHIVDIPYNYWAARYPVTNEQYYFYTKDKGIEHPVSDWHKKKKHPVTYVSWNAAIEYCEWISILIKEELPSQMDVRLPIESEWEKAARGTDGREYPWGNVFDKDKCNSKEGEKSGTTDVGSYSPQGDSPYGCCDMSGNVWEWTHSAHKPYPYNANDGRESENTNLFRVLRGGHYNYESIYTRCAYRFRFNREHGNWYPGFRIVIAPSLRPS